MADGLRLALLVLLVAALGAVVARARARAHRVLREEFGHRRGDGGPEAGAAPSIGIAPDVVSALLYPDTDGADEIRFPHATTVLGTDVTFFEHFRNQGDPVRSAGHLSCARISLPFASPFVAVRAGTVSAADDAVAARLLAPPLLDWLRAQAALHVLVFAGRDALAALTPSDELAGFVAELLARLPASLTSEADAR